MEFYDQYITNLNINNCRAFHRLIVHMFCGQEMTLYKQSFSGDFEFDVYKKFLQQLKSEGINHAGFNELLLTLHQNRVSKYFFNYFFCSNYFNKTEKKYHISTIKELKNGIILFRGYAMLSFGNIRYALKKLSNEQLKESDIRNILLPFSENGKYLNNKLVNRPNPIISTKDINIEDLWMNGEVTKSKIEKSRKDITITKEIIEKYYPSNKNDYVNSINKILERYDDGEQRAKEVQIKARVNTDIYLTQDYMDVYIATSMRDDWEFMETNNFINHLFKHEEIRNIKLRYFNPTNSVATDRIDKGLIEGLILRRCKCTIYMVQGYDTMGKDSELATTLVQGKPVIAYIPKKQRRVRIREIKNYPLLFFNKMHYAFQLGSTYQINGCYKEIKNFGGFERVDDFINRITEYSHLNLKRFPKNISQNEKSIITRNFLYYPFTNEEQKHFKDKNKNIFNDVCQIMTIAEKYNLNKRADLLKSKHPLGIQINLKNGVANGVLVVRDISKCAKLLNRIVHSNLSLNFKYEKRKLNTLLQERISNCVYRSITHDQRLTNSFWNLYSIS